MVDSEPGVLSSIQVTHMGALFRQGINYYLFNMKDNFIMGECGAGNNWAKAYYTEGTYLIKY